MKFQDVSYCPDLVDECPASDVLDMRRRVLFPVRIETGQVNGEVTLHTRFSRNQLTKVIL